MSQHNIPLPHDYASLSNYPAGIYNHKIIGADEYSTILFLNRISTNSKWYSYEMPDVNSNMTARNHDRKTFINQEIATKLRGEAKAMLARGLSGRETASALGKDIVAQQLVARMSLDLLQKLLERSEPFQRQIQIWSSQEIVDAKFSIIDELREELIKRDEEYERLTEDLLLNGFSYRDVLGDKAVRAGADSKSPENAVMYARELVRFQLMNKGASVTEAVQDIRWRFDNMRSLLPDSIKLSIFAESNSWILWDIAKQEALKDKDYRSSVDDQVNYSGCVIANSENEDSLQQVDFMRNVIAWRHLGWELQVKTINGEDVSWLDSSLDDDTRSLLYKVGDEDHHGQLSSSEYTDLGRGVEASLRRAQAQ